MSTPAHRLHIATLSNDLSAYAEMRQSMAAFGYTEDCCRFTLFDNSQSNMHEPFDVLRHMPTDGIEPYIVLCHQDLRFGAESSIDRLLGEIDRLNRTDDGWAVAGTAGCSKGGAFFVNLDEPAGSFRAKGLPARVVSLDENFLLLRRENFPPVSDGLHGFHFYGTDLCLNAYLLRRSAYVIDLPLTHLSSGNAATADFEQMRVAVNDHWREQFWMGVVQTLVSEVRVCRLPFVERWLAKHRSRKLVQMLGLAIILRPGARKRASRRVSR